MKKWEYRFDRFYPMNTVDAVTRLDKFGREGWELVTSFIEREGEVGLIFKREGEAIDTSEDER